MGCFGIKLAKAPIFAEKIIPILFKGYTDYK